MIGPVTGLAINMIISMITRKNQFKQKFSCAWSPQGRAGSSTEWFLSEESMRRLEYGLHWLQVRLSFCYLDKFFF